MLFRFQLLAAGKVRSFESHSALAALGTDVVRGAPLGAELLDDKGVVLARRERLWVDPAWLEAWQPTDAWTEDAPVTIADLASLLDDDGDEPLFLTSSADDARTSPVPQRSLRALGGEATGAPRRVVGNSSADSKIRKRASSAQSPRSGQTEESNMDHEFEVEGYRELQIDLNVDVDHDKVGLRDPQSGELFVVSRKAFAQTRMAKAALAAVQGA